MAANGPKDEVEWNLDWDDLTEGSADPPPTPLPTSTPSPASAPQPANSASASSPPPLSTPPRAFPTPAATFPDAEPAAIVEPQRLPTRAPQPPAIPPATFLPPAVAASSPAPIKPPIAGPVRNLVRGQRLRLAEVLPGDPPPAFAVGLEIAAQAGVALDLCCFGLDEAGKLSDDRYLIFYNQKSSPEGALSVRGACGEIFRVELGRLPATVRRLVFTATVDGAGSVRALGASRFELHPLGGQTVARYEFSGDDLDEVKALMVAEIYYKDGWRVGAVGQGFAGGLRELLRHFGGQEV